MWLIKRSSKVLVGLEGIEVVGAEETAGVLLVEGLEEGAVGRSARFRTVGAAGPGLLRAGDPRQV